MARERESRLTSGRLQNQLVQGHALAAGLGDSGASSFSEAQSSNVELGDVVNSLVISHSRHDNGSAVAEGSNAPITYNLLFRCLINLESETGVLLTLEETSLRRTVLEKPESVLRDRNLKSFTSRWWYRFLLLLSFFDLFYILPLLTKSMP